MSSLPSAASSLWDMRVELRRENAIFVLPGASGLGVILIWTAEASKWPWHATLLGLPLVLLPLVALLLLERCYRAAAWLVVLGCLAVNLLVLLWFPSGTAYVLLALPTGLATLLVGPAGGALVGAAATLLVAKGPIWFPASANAWWFTSLTMIWGTQALMWASLRLGERAFQSLWPAYTNMLRLLEEARDQRLELKEIQQDLLLANKELARLSERLAVMHEIAEDARRAKGQFVANVSHELRTPLNMIVGFAQVISETPDAYSGQLPPALLADIDVILRNSKHLAALVDDVLDLSQLEAERVSLDRERVCLCELCEEVAVAVRPLFEAKGLQLDLDVAEDLPPLFCDRTRIRQVILNLASNAGRFTEHGGVRIGARDEASVVVVYVSDTGPGIAPEHQERIFEPFQQIDSSIRRRSGGTGLGLSISRRFVEMHGGRMWLESHLGCGSTFYFTLPVQTPEAPVSSSALRWLSPDSEYRVRPRRSRAPQVKPGARFVVLETGSAVQRLLMRLPNEPEVETVATMEQAIETLSTSPAQALIVNDAAVGEGSTLVAERAVTIPYGTPVIACRMPGEEEAAASLGVVHYLVKPILREDLAAALDGICQETGTVLVVDDEPEVLQLMTRMLRSLGRGLRVLRASDGERALALLRERQPDLVLLDLIMPGVDGYQLLQEKRSDPSIDGIPVIVISAQDPVGGSVVGSSFTLTRGGGLTGRDLLACVQFWSEATMAPQRSADPELPGSPYD